jgi:hypothetical protein
LLIAHCSLLIAHCSLLIAHCSLLIAHCSLLISPFTAEQSSKKRKVELKCDICFEVFHEQQKFDAHKHAKLGRCLPYTVQLLPA